MWTEDARSTPEGEEVAPDSHAAAGALFRQRNSSPPGALGESQWGMTRRRWCRRLCSRRAHSRPLSCLSFVDGARAAADRKSRRGTNKRDTMNEWATTMCTEKYNPCRVRDAAIYVQKALVNFCCFVSLSLPPSEEEQRFMEAPSRNRSEERKRNQ